MAVVLRGTVVSFDATHRVLDDGAVYVGDDGRLASVAPASDPAPAGFANARQVMTRAVIYPGLIDLHNHIAYNTLPLWEAPGVPYQHHNSWTREDDVPDYGSSVTWPSRVLGQAAAEALIKYVEVKALVGGTTAIQGAPHVTRPVDGWLIRIVDVEKLPAGKDVVMAAVIQKEVPDLQADAAKLDGSRVYIYHLAEGVPGSIVHKEFDNLGTALCLKPGLIGVHATALTGADFKAWQAAVTAIDPAERATVVWSPFSNLFLYHQTTDVLEADAKGVRIALGADWAPSGTKHVLGELKVADAFNRESLGGHFSDEQLCDMVTANPGDALATAWGPQIGRLQQGNAADLVVLERRDPDPYRNLIEATERHVRLVMVRGKPFYGTPALMTAAGATDSNPITVAGLKRRVCVRQPGVDAQLDWSGVRRALEKVRDDPVTAWQDAQHALASWGGALDDPDAPLVVFGDMPEGDLDVMAGSGEIPLDLEIPRLDSFTHDSAFFAAVARSGPPELQHLAAYYP
jgi:cytosine/adenosine deaminase-related metal-dependent hydrolase